MSLGEVAWIAAAAGVAFVLGLFVMAAAVARTREAETANARKAVGDAEVAAAAAERAFQEHLHTCMRESLRKDRQR